MQPGLCVLTDRGYIAEAGDARQKTVGAAARDDESLEAADLDRTGWRGREGEVAGGWAVGSDERVKAGNHSTSEVIQIEPLRHEELKLIGEVGVDEVADQSPFDSIVRLLRVIGRTIGKIAAHNARLLGEKSGDGFISWIAATDMRANWTSDAFGIGFGLTGRRRFVQKHVQAIGRNGARAI